MTKTFITSAALLIGKNVTDEAGTSFTAFVDGNFALDPAKFKAVSQK